MDVSIQFDDQSRFVTVKIHDEPSDDLLSSEMDSRLIHTQFLPENFLGGGRFMLSKSVANPQ